MSEVDNFAVDGGNVHFTSVTVTPDGQVYVAALVEFSGSPPTALIRKGSDAGMVWTTVQTVDDHYPGALTSDTCGNVYATITTPNSYAFQALKQSAGNDFFVSFQSALPNGRALSLVPGPGGILYAFVETDAGSAAWRTSNGANWTPHGTFANATIAEALFTPGGTVEWVGRQDTHWSHQRALPDGLGSWVDSPVGAFASGRAGISTADNTVYVTGRGGDDGGAYWDTYRSVDGGSWLRVDRAGDVGAQVEGTGIVATSLGIFTSGMGCLTGGCSEYHWLVRSSPGGGFWTMSDDGGPGDPAGARAIAADNDDHVYVVGSKAVGSTLHGIVKRMDCTRN